MSCSPLGTCLSVLPDHDSGGSFVCILHASLDLDTLLNIKAGLRNDLHHWAHHVRGGPRGTKLVSRDSSFTACRGGKRGSEVQTPAMVTRLSDKTVDSNAQPPPSHSAAEPRRPWRHGQHVTPRLAQGFPPVRSLPSAEMTAESAQSTVLTDVGGDCCSGGRGLPEETRGQTPGEFTRTGAT